MEKILRGRPVADFLTESVQTEVDKLKSKGVYPKIAMVKVGNKDDDSAAYQRGATNRCLKCNITVENIILSEGCSQGEYIQTIKDLNEDESLDAILCFCPLPENIDENKVKNIIDPEKDVDCFSPVNITKIFSGDKNGFAPCTPMGIMEILDYYEIDLEGKNVVILGRSLVVSKPLSMLMINKNATVTICHSKTKNVAEVASKADILISSIGSAKMVDDSYVKEGAIVIDVGINFDENGKLCGDVDYEKVEDKAGAITPVPGGVGAVTTSVLARQVVNAAKNRRKHDEM